MRRVEEIIRGSGRKTTHSMISEQMHPDALWLVPRCGSESLSLGFISPDCVLTARTPPKGVEMTV